MLHVVGPAQATGQFHIGRDLIVDLAKSRPGIQPVGIFAAEIIVALAVYLAERIGINVGAADSGKNEICRVGRLRIARICKRGIEGDVW